ncbi:MAG: hypothetical protein ACRC33_19850 [Gemmataceae bacterium]
MPLDPSLTLAVARHLVEAAHGLDRESSSRTAVSRASYAAFRHALAYATERERFVPRGAGEDHGRLLAVFTRRFNRVWRGLSALRDWRWSADYDGQGANFDAMAADAVVTALDVISCLPLGPPA